VFVQIAFTKRPASSLVGSALEMGIVVFNRLQANTI